LVTEAALTTNNTITNIIINITGMSQQNGSSSNGCEWHGPRYSPSFQIKRSIWRAAIHRTLQTLVRDVRRAVGCGYGHTAPYTHYGLRAGWGVKPRPVRQDCRGGLMWSWSYYRR
jgi:hypothetical protein